MAGSPVRPALSRPNTTVTRMPARRITEHRANVWCDRAREWGISYGKEKATKEAIGLMIDRFLDGDPNLMTREQLGDAAVLLVKLAAEVTDMRLRVPIEPYVLAQMSEKDREWYARNQPDWDIDLPLDDEDGDR
jgi:hypothetical protein